MSAIYHCLLLDMNSNFNKMKEEMTFNDLPEVVSRLFSKIERVERLIESIDKRMVQAPYVNEKEHIPMNLNEACDFLKMKRSTMYYHIERGNIPSTKKGKYHIFFKDELLHWLESGRKRNAVLTHEDQNESIRRFVKSRSSKTKGTGLV